MEEKEEKEEEEEEEEEMESYIDSYKDFELCMRLNFKNNSLYELSNVLVDINQILTFCDLIEKGYSSYAIRNFGRVKYIDRDSRILESSKNFIIKEVSNGSIIIILTGIGAFSAVIAVILAHELNKRDRMKNEMITFDIRCHDNNRVKDIIDRYKYYGLNHSNINDLMRTLEINDYDVESNGREDTYKITDAQKISKILNLYADRIISTVYIVPKNK